MLARWIKGVLGTNGLAMGYSDGNTVTAMWNYAQRFGMSDNMRMTIPMALRHQVHSKSWRPRPTARRSLAGLRQTP